MPIKHINKQFALILFVSSTKYRQNKTRQSKTRQDKIGWSTTVLDIGSIGWVKLSLRDLFGILVLEPNVYRAIISTQLYPPVNTTSSAGPCQDYDFWRIRRLGLVVLRIACGAQGVDVILCS
jgi:hypothetical protein